MQEKIRISIVIASFNGESYIESQILSFLRYLKDFDEIVISDDGSSDRTVEIIKSIDDKRVRLVANGPNLGYQGNFQRAILASKGDFVFFSDQDDICLNSRFEESLRLLKSFDCVFGDAVLVDANLNIIDHSYFNSRKLISNNIGFFSLFLKPKAIGATMACKRNFLLSALPFPSGVPHDHWLSMLSVLKGRLGISNESFILYRRHSKSVSLTGIASKRSFFLIIAERFRLLKSLIFYLLKKIG